jgi:hypothetical protein
LLASSNYNIWHLTKEAFAENDNNVNLPSVVCTHCLSEKHAISFSTVTCKMCHELMPSNIQPTAFENVHSVVDTNYVQWPVCNTCSADYWSTNIKCICGTVCHEADMIQLNSSKIIQHVNKQNSFICWTVLNAIAPTDGHEDIVLSITKLCRQCASLSGTTTSEGLQAISNLLNDGCWNIENHPLSNNNICYIDAVFFSQAPVFPSPSIISYIKNQNTAKIGYAVQYSQMF